ncbi:MAG: hypothetical protein R3B46_09915 [Phycisphaerales bacterium]
MGTQEEAAQNAVKGVGCVVHEPADAGHARTLAISWGSKTAAVVAWGARDANPVGGSMVDSTCMWASMSPSATNAYEVGAFCFGGREPRRVGGDAGLVERDVGGFDLAREDIDDACVGEDAGWGRVAPGDGDEWFGVMRSLGMGALCER